METTFGTRILAFLGIEEDETRSAVLMTAHSFFMGCATVFFETAASATFLARFPSSYLPWVYIAAAGANTVTGSIYAHVQQRVSFARLMRGTLWFLFFLVASVRGGLALSGGAWAAFAGLVSYRMVSSLTDLEYWAVASRIYDVRQAKRLFGVVGSGEVIARIAGSFSVPLLVGIGGVQNLMVLSAGGLATCLVLVGMVLRAADGVDLPPSVVFDANQKPVQQGLRQRVREILASPYLSLVVVVAILATFGKYFVDFAYLEQVSTLSRGEEQLARFLGLFNGVTQVLSLLTRLFASRFVLNRFGIRVGVMILPLLQTACSAITVAVGLLGGGPTAVFAGVIANQGIYKTFKHPIDNASFKVLYQPLKPRQRLAAQIAVEILFSPLVVGLAGVVMLLFSTITTYDPVRFSFVLLLCFGAWAVAARTAGRRYGQALLEMIRLRIEGNVTLPFDDATTLGVLRARAASAAPAEACVALDLLEKAGARDIVDTLLARTNHASAEVRRYAIERLVELRPEALAPVRERLSEDPSPTVRGAAILARATTAAATSSTLELVRHLHDADVLVRRAAVAALLALRDAEATDRALEAIERFSEAQDPESRRLAARLAGEHRLEHTVVKLVSDGAPSVRRAALTSAGRVRSSSLVPALVSHLRDPRFAQSAARALAAYGEAIVGRLEALLRGDPDPLFTRRLIYVYRLLGGEAGARALEAHLESPDVGVRARVYAALDRLGWVASGKDRETVEHLLLEESRAAAWALRAALDVAVDPGLRALANALEEEVDGARERAFDLLAFIRDPVAIHRAAHHLARSSKDRRAYAVEVLDLLIDSDARSAVLPLLDSRSPDARERLLERSSVPTLDPRGRLLDVLGRSEPPLRTFTQAVAVSLATSHEDGELRAAARRALLRHPPVRELCTARDGDPSTMLPIEKIILLKTLPMFSSTSEELLAEIAPLLDEIEYASGATVFSKGDAGDSMYMVVSGRVRVFDGDKTLSELGEKEIFGELALLDPAPRSASVAALQDTRLFRLDGDVFAELMAGSLEIVRGVLHVLCDRLRKTSAVASRL